MQGKPHPHETIMNPPSLSEICLPYDGLFEKLSEEGVSTVAEFQAVLADTGMTQMLGLKMGQVIALKRVTSARIVPPQEGGRIPLRESDVPKPSGVVFSMSEEELLRHVVLSPYDGTALSLARLKFPPRLVVDPKVVGGGRASILIGATVDLCLDTRDAPPGFTWPAVYAKVGYVMTWDQVITETRPWYCPFSGEEVSPERQTSSLDYAGILMSDVGLLAFFSVNAEIMRMLGPRGLLFALRGDRSKITDRALLISLQTWAGLSYETQCWWAESVFVKPSYEQAPQRKSRVSPEMHRLFVSAFSSDELTRLLRWLPSGGAELATRVPVEGSPNSTAQAVLDICDEAGRLGDLINTAIKERNRRAHEFQPLLDALSL